MAIVTDGDNAWRNLANAIVIQAVQDYEYLVSDKPMFSTKDKVTKTEIRLFAVKQQLVNVDVSAILDRVDRVYQHQFRPYVRQNYKSILEMTRKSKKHPAPWSWLQDNTPYKCPFCGGALRQGAAINSSTDYIVCSQCNLNMRIPKEDEQCTT